MIIITWQESTSCTVVCLILRMFEDIFLENAQAQLFNSFCFSLGTCLGENLKCFWLFRFSFILTGWIKYWNLIENQIPISQTCLTCAPKLIIRNGRNLNPRDSSNTQICIPSNIRNNTHTERLLMFSMEHLYNTYTESYSIKRKPKKAYYCKTECFNE